METVKQVGIWIRVSTDFQVRDESPEIHEQRARYYTQAKGWEVVEVYRLDAVSGKTVMHHPEAKRMLKDIRSGRITGLVFSKLARLARSTKELLEFADIFRKEGADLISLAEQIDTSSPAGRLFFTMISAMAQWEREEISSRVAASIPVRARLGRRTGGAATFGYKWENGTFDIDEKEAPIRKLMYELFLKNHRRKTTANELNALGYRTRNGSPFSDNSVDRLLRDPTAKGFRRANYTRSGGEGKSVIIKPQEEWVIMPCPAIITEETYNQVHTIIAMQEQKSKRTGKKAVYLLSGFVKCDCGKSMYVSKKTQVYICQPCKRRIQVADIDEIYQEYLKGYLQSFNKTKFLTSSNTLIAEKQALLTQTTDERKKLSKKFETFLELRSNEELSKEQFIEHCQPLNVRIAQLDEAIPELQADVDFLSIQMVSSDVVLDEAKQLSNQWAEMPIEEKRTIVETITDSITIKDEDIDIALCFLPSSSEIGIISDTSMKLCRQLFFQRKTLQKLIRVYQPIVPKTLGDHIMNKRKILGLQQKDLALLIGVTEESISRWEANKYLPHISFFPRVVKFLGYEWWRFDTETLIGKIQDYRFRHGLTCYRFALLLNVNQTTVCGWEVKGRVPLGKTVEKLNKLLETPKPLI